MDGKKGEKVDVENNQPEEEDEDGDERFRPLHIPGQFMKADRMQFISITICILFKQFILVVSRRIFCYLFLITVSNKSSQDTFIYIAVYAIYIVLKHLHINKQENNSVIAVKL